MKNTIKDPGLGYNSNKNIKSFIDENGESSIIHQNRPRNINDLYTYLIHISWIKFFGFIVFGYLLINSFFALIYLTYGVEKISISTDTLFSEFLHAFFFSAQTVTTLGYGASAPTDIVTGLISSFEALLGLLSFSFVTGLLYGRFSKPKASVRFSKNMVYRKFEDSHAIMFRLVSKRTSIMIEPEAKVTLSISKKTTKNEFKREFFSLKLEREAITYLPTVWTLVHIIEKGSPLYKYTEAELTELKAKLIILFQYHEDSFSQKVYQIHSYDFDKLLINRKFAPSVSFNEDGYTVLDHDAIDKTEPMD
ncbi:ion channel [Flavicella sediminum]|uniref:ion channel n=1 Tax=Flavicella sediminum TaxID=2585141 RepID=UPI0011204AE6|nr:ion channel [Flavicella sediminum]